MYSLAPDRVVSSAELWARLVTRREIDAALVVLDDAGAALVRLVDDADWESQGLRALHALLGRLRDDTGVELGHLRVREWEATGGEG
ncbi:hypothetical protein ACI2IP_07230 [Microbacterium sp. NPDC090218]